MKYLWFGLAMIVAAFALASVNSYIIESKLTEISDCLDRAEQAVFSGDKNAAQSAADEALELWNRKYSYFASVMRHDVIDRFEEMLHLAARGIEQNSDGVKDAIINAKAEIKNMIHSETMCIGNVL